LTQAALNQDWDPSVQALVVFPGVLKYLTEDIAWTTNLGNAFLAQEGDVMDAIQRMRDRASRSGKLATTAEQQVIRAVDSGRPVYEILPTNPTVVYVPVYDPYWIWGAPVYYPYARWYYPPHVASLYFGSAVYIDAYFGTRWYGSSWNGPGYQAWNSWGWRPAWNSRNVVVNNVFINNHHFNNTRSYGSTGTVAWSHDVSHRRGVIYPATTSYDRYRRDPRDVARPQQAYSQSQSRSGPAQVTSRNAGTINASRPSDRTSTNYRPDGRQDSRTVTRQDTRVAGPSPANRDSRSSDLRNERSYTSTARSSQSYRPSTPAPAVPSQQSSSWSGTTRRSTSSPSVTAPAVRSESPSNYRGTTSDRPRQEQYSGPRQAAPSVAAPSTTYQAPRQSAPVARQSAPEARYSGPAQRSTAPSVVQGSPRQSAPSSGAASAVRSAPAQHESSSSSHAQGGGHSSNSSSSSSSDGGHSHGRR